MDQKQFSDQRQLELFPVAIGYRMDLLTMLYQGTQDSTLYTCMCVLVTLHDDDGVCDIQECEYYTASP